MAAIAGAFLVLLSVVIASAVGIDSDAFRTKRAVVLNSLYQHAASGVAAEESLERKYRLEPGSTPRANHEIAEAEVEDAIALIRASGSAQDRQLMSKVAAQHAQYV